MSSARITIIPHSDSAYIPLTTLSGKPDPAGNPIGETLITFSLRFIVTRRIVIPNETRDLPSAKAHGKNRFLASSKYEPAPNDILLLFSSRSRPCRTLLTLFL
jgi:hypothetical protein